MSDIVFYLCPHDLDKRRERCLMCNPQDALDSRTVAMYAANETANREAAHAKALAEALRSVVDVHSTVLMRTTHPHCCWYVDKHGPDCDIGRALAAYDEDHEEDE